MIALSTIDAVQPHHVLIYIVDSRFVDYRSLIETLADEGLRIELFPDAAAALRNESGLLPDIWLVNIQLADMAGVDLLALLRERCPGVPICLVGDSNRVEDEILARCSGPEMYFTKPLHPSWLMALTAPPEFTPPLEFTALRAFTPPPEFTALRAFTPPPAVTLPQEMPQHCVPPADISTYLDVPVGVAH